MGQFANQLEQVALTYLTRRWLVFGMLAPFVGVALFTMLATLENSNKLAAFGARSLAVPFFVVIPLLVLHAKIQFAHSRAKLVSNFAVAHLIITTLVAFCSLVIYSVVFAFATGLDPLGAMAYALAISLPAMWACQLNRGSLIVVSFVLMLSVMGEWTLNWWFMPEPAHRLWHLLIVAVGWIGIAVWLWRLAQLSEESDDYEVPPFLKSDRPSRGENVAAKQFARNRLLSGTSDWWLAQIRPNRQSGGRNARRLLAYGLSGLPAWISAIFMGIAMLLLALIMSQLTFLGGPSPRRAVVPLLYAMLIVPGLAPLTQLVQHRRRLPEMLLFPLTRTDLIDGLLVAIARGVVLNWLALVLVFAFILTAFPGERISPSTAAVFLFLSAALTIVSFGLGVQFATWEGAIKRTLAFAGCFGVLFAPVMAWWQERQLIGDVPFVLLSIFLAAIGAGIIARARQKWLNLELG
jgi:hypothetical protein